MGLDLFVVVVVCGSFPRNDLARGARVSPDRERRVRIRTHESARNGRARRTGRRRQRPSLADSPAEGFHLVCDPRHHHRRWWQLFGNDRRNLCRWDRNPDPNECQQRRHESARDLSANERPVPDDATPHEGRQRRRRLADSERGQERIRKVNVILRRGGRVRLV